MLTEPLKEAIQTAYSRLLEEKGYRARHCQKTMIAEIARTLGNVPEDNSICVVEAGTGTGKTIAYAMASIPIAKQLKKKVVIATATVALQEQIIYQDLPDIRLHSGLEFSFALAKGRRRYLCLSRLDLALQDAGQVNQNLSFFENADDASAPVDSVIFDSMLTALGKGEWDGERDSWPEEVDQATWARVSTDHAQCTNRQCSHFENCYFYRARENIHRVDCIVTNHDLVLSDLMMGGGAVLPEPKDTIYIFDEGHHLPDKAGNHFSHFLALYSTKTWLQQIPTSLKLASAEIPAISPALINDINSMVEQANQRLDDAAQVLQVLKVDAEEQDDGWQYRFPKGQVGDAITSVSKQLAVSFERMDDLLGRVVLLIEGALENVSAAQRGSIEYWLSMVGSVSMRLSAGAELWHNFSKAVHSPPYARWVSFSTQSQAEGMEIQLSCHPVSVADELFERLWSRCAGAVLTSATLSVAKDFSSFQSRSGIPPEMVFTSLASPFRYQEQAVLSVPKMRTDPGQADQHTQEVAELIPGLVSDDLGALVLFTSWRQMLRVFDDIDEVFRERVLMQGELSKMEIISRHRDAIDRGEASCIFGLASFSEGVDLPGDYCRHVVIAKIPFSVPDDPVDATLSEWIEEKGGNSFYELMLPNAAIKVVQAAGRLLRTETDEGTVTILDRRVVSKSYGKVILNSLPPFARDIS
ncbi:MAG: ATP-dependent DNA helicase DinG [Candidatus Azotimanducaceae bacterium WSBS_2022_MAG_OTU7]